MFTKQLGDIIAYVDQLKEVDTTGVAPMEHTPHEGENVVRDDLQQDSLPQEKALSQAPEQEDGQFRVPRVVE
jgi:aspartyl-tRNA(Asn)/glutamyl-tRNA(Gln) amidotransferase subunit C